MLDCATQDVASNVVAQDLGKDVIFSTANGRVPWSKGRCVCWKCMCSMLACSFYNTCNVLKWDLMGFLTSYLFSGVLQKSHEVSLSLIGSHGSMTARVEVWEQYLNISEYDPRHASRHLVGLEALVLATHDMHMSQWYEVVLCQCADCAVWDAHSNGMGVGWVLLVHCSSTEDVDKWR